MMEMSGMDSSVLRELDERGMIEQVTHEQLDEVLTRDSVSLYVGFDPTAESLHVGNLLPIFALAHFARHGHEPVAVLGGATGLIGDPSGKDEERQLKTKDEVDGMVQRLGRQIQTVMERAVTRHSGEGGKAEADKPVQLRDNADWLEPWSYIDFLRDIGKYFRVNAMISKDSVKHRLEQREQGISYTEFSYMVIQAYDFLKLYDEQGCVLQIGGSDQWGNITAGTELIRRRADGQAYGLTTPLLTTAEGNKLGKTEDGAVWLDPEMTSPYEFYQYWVRRRDEDVPELLRFFTFLPTDEIDELVERIEAGKNRGEVQQKLAFEVTAVVHGEREAEKAVRASEVLYGETIENMTDAELEQIFADVPSSSVSRDALSGEGVSIIDLFANSELQSSRGAAKRLIRQGGAYLNNEKVEDIGYRVTRDDLASESTLVLRSGKKNYALVRVKD